MFINFKSAHESKTYRRGNIRTRNTRRMILNWNVMLQRVAMYKTLRVRFNIFFLLKKKKRSIACIRACIYGFARGGKHYFVKKQVRNWCQPSVNISSSSLQDNTMCK